MPQELRITSDRTCTCPMCASSAPPRPPSLIDTLRASRSAPKTERVSSTTKRQTLLARLLVMLMPPAVK